MYRNVLCLVLGLIVGIRLTDFWDYFKLTTCKSEQLGPSTVSGGTPPATPHAQQQQYQQQHQQEQQQAQLADWLYNETRVLCFVLTQPSNHHTKAWRVKSTWGQRCNKLIFMSTAGDVELGAVKLPVQEGREHLYEKMRAALAYIYERHLDEYDWFLKADDDTYVIVENLRLLLYPYDPESAVYFGCKFHPFVTKGYMSGGAGYVLSRDALRRYNLFAKNNTKFCKRSGEAEDREIGNCLQNVGVVAADARDAQGRERFLPFAPRHLIPKIIGTSWLERFWYFKPNISDCCSHSAVSFHYTKEFDFGFYEYVLYKLRAFGVHGADEASDLPPRLNSTQMQTQLRIWSEAVSDNTDWPPELE